MINPLLDRQYNEVTNAMTGLNRVIVPFVACGDLRGYDSDKNYPLEVGGAEYEYKEPVQKPINPPYKTFLESKKAQAT